VLTGACAVAAAGVSVPFAGCAAVANDVGKRGLSIATVGSSSGHGPDTEQVDVRVRNRWIATVTATLEAEVAVQNGNTYRKRREIAVESGAERTFSFSFTLRAGEAATGIRPSARLV